jgi:hypothetical protein
VTWFILFVGVVVVCFVAALVLGLIGGGSVGGLGGETRSLSHEPLPDDAIVDADFEDLVFDVGLRGYRMSQVDGVVDRLRRELRDKDDEIAVLRAGAQAPPHPAVTAETAVTASTAPTAPTAPTAATGQPAQPVQPAQREQHERRDQPEQSLGHEPRP